MSLARNGYAWLDLVLRDAQCDALIDAVPDLAAGRGGLRHLDTHPLIERLARDEQFLDAMRAYVDEQLTLVNATLFDKTPDANWRVQWHQDRFLAMREREERAGWGPWRRKDGVWHAGAPADVLGRIVAVRIHLDECGADNGPLRVVPGSHRDGLLSADAIAEFVTRGPIAELHAPRGAMLVMRPLLVHASSPALTPRHRRVLHLEFVEGDLGG